jgi:hypothetical protein
VPPRHAAGSTIDSDATHIPVIPKSVKIIIFLAHSHRTCLVCFSKS